MAQPILSAAASCTLAVLLPLALAACVTPTYPTQLSGSARPAATPSAVVAPAPASPEVSETSSTAAATAAVASPPVVAVESAPLPPASASSASPPPSSPSSAQPTSPAQSAISPNYTPPRAAIVEPAPIVAPPAPIAITAPRPAPPPVAVSTPVRYRQAPGRVIAGGRVVAAVGMYRDYVVQPHDHVDAIARDLQTSRKVLVDANHLQTPFSLQPGQHLKVPVAKAYEAQAGDTIAEVAKRFSVATAELAELNDLSERARLRSGDKLALPDRFEDRGPTRLPAVMVAQRAPRTSPPARTPTYAATPAAAAFRSASYSARPMNEPPANG
ncbi:MAG: LysM peptidoglycan-binding domain-containing protein, partial [Caulobacteraceae bacterium]